VVAALAVDAFWLEPSSLRLEQHDVAVPDAPVLKGLRIAVISDLHGGSNFIGGEKIDRVTRLTNAAHPDIILLTGDYVVSIHRLLGAHHIPIEAIVAHLKPLHAPLGVYAVIGNHDRWEDAARITRAFEHAGIGVLENAPVAIRTARGVLHLAGIGDFHTHASNPAQALTGVPKRARALCFTHSPDVFPLLPSTCALTVAGHTHGGQVALPLLGRLVVPSHYGQRYASGTVRENGKTLFISPGIGTSILPVRFGVPPEISLLTVR
jgi:predicted MPP superfamily phosphohydrolase